MALDPVARTPCAGEADQVFEARRDALAVPASARYVGTDPGSAALHDVALLSAMTGLFAGVSHAFALMRGTDVAPREFAPLLTAWLTLMERRLAEGHGDEGTTGVIDLLVR